MNELGKSGNSGQRELISRSLDENNALNAWGELLLTEFMAADYWGGRTLGERPDGEGADDDDTAETKSALVPAPVPDKWEMTRGIVLHPWQKECVDKWYHAGEKGVVKVVTGAGKTIFALHLMERLQREKAPNLKVTVLVPTIVLLEQWYDFIIGFGNLPATSIGRLGGGYKDDFSNGRRILVCVLNSASMFLDKLVRDAGVGPELLLIVDECHRAAATERAKIFTTPRRFTLGLSATPEPAESVIETEDDESGEASEEPVAAPAFADTVVGKELGGIIYELAVEKAISLGLLSTFEIRHYGLPLSDQESGAYKHHSHEIRELRKTLEARCKQAKGLGGGKLVGYARRLAANSRSPVQAEAAQYVQEVSRRKRLLFRAEARLCGVRHLIHDAFAQNPDARIILFHESIQEVMSIYFALFRDGIPVAVDHSKLKESLRAAFIRQFRNGVAKVLVSARSVIEGFDVPAADIGIVVASSSSVRQRIQTLGRVLRKPKDATTAKCAVMHVFYMAGTVDEMIYKKHRWDEIIGADRNRYFVWDPSAMKSDPISKDDPPCRPDPREKEVDWSKVVVGGVYPGDYYEGKEYKCAAQGNIETATGEPVVNPQDVPDMVLAVAPKARYLRVTPGKHAILVRCQEANGTWCTRLAGFMHEPFKVAGPGRVSTSAQQKATGPHPPPSVSVNLKPGEEYPFGGQEGVEYKLIQRSGRLRIQEPNGRYNALFSTEGKEPEKGKDAERVEAEVKQLQRTIGKILKIRVLPNLDVVTWVSGKWLYVTRLNAGLEFLK